jgi:hypothetical protein
MNEKAIQLTILFKQDIMPKEEGLKKQDFGQCAIRSDGLL